MNYPNQPLHPRLLPNEIVKFTSSNRKYTVHFWYPMREYEFTPLDPEGKSYTYSEEKVVEAVKSGKIVTWKMPEWWSRT